MNKTLTNKQIAFIVFSCVVGYEIISLPKTIAKNFSTTGWMFILGSIFIMLFYAYIFIYLAKTFNNQTIFEYSQILTGKCVAYIILLFISINSIVTSSLISRLFNETIKLTFLISTPSWALSLLLSLVVFYTLLNDLKVLGRIFEIFSIVIILSAVFILFGILTEADFTNLQPFIQFDDIDLSIKSLSSIFLPFLGIEILAVIPMNKKNNNKVLLHTFLIIIFIGILYIFIVESCIAVMGVDSMAHYDDALIATVRRIDIDFLQFLKRLDSIFIIFTLFSIYSTIVLTLYVAIFLIHKLLPKIPYALIVSIVIILAYILGLIPQTMDSLITILDYTGYLGLFNLLILPLIFLILTLIKKRFKKL